MTEKDPVFKLESARVGHIDKTGKFVDAVNPPSEPWRPLGYIRPNGEKVLTESISVFSALQSGVIATGVLIRKDLDERAKQFFSHSAFPVPVVGIEFRTRRVKLRRSILKYQGKPMGKIHLKSIVRFPRVMVERVK